MDIIQEREDREAAGLVACDELDCPAREEPDLDDLQQLRDALVHWREHGYLSGCSHAN